MSELEKMGVAVQRKFRSSSTSLNGIQLSSSDFTQLELTLPRATPVKVTFSREGIGSKLSKIFKKEIQTGDLPFDDAIFISTDTPDATKAFLESEEIRNAIVTCVVGAGSIKIEGTSVTLEVPGQQHEDPGEALAIVRGLLR